MEKTLIGTVVFVRHGETDYTDIFPDLTEFGIKTIKNSAAAIKKIYNEYRGLLSLASSPSARALGSASIIANILKYIPEIKEAPLLGPAKIIDVKKSKALFDEYFLNGRMRQLAVDYGRDERFEDGKIIEPRSQIRKRFYKYLSALVSNMLKRDSAPFTVNVSHYETLYNLVEIPFQLDYAKEPPLGFGELILALFYNMGSQKEVRVCLTFRGKSANNVVFNCETESISLSS